MSRAFNMDRVFLAGNQSNVVSRFACRDLILGNLDVEGGFDIQYSLLVDHEYVDYETRREVSVMKKVEQNKLDAYLKETMLEKTELLQNSELSSMGIVVTLLDIFRNQLEEYTASHPYIQLVGIQFDGEVVAYGRSLRDLSVEAMEQNLHYHKLDEANRGNTEVDDFDIEDLFL